MSIKCANANLTFEEKELMLLRDAADKAQQMIGEKVATSKEVKDIISILEHFLRTKKLICYGGTAINNILPVTDQFYQKGIEVPDYDFYSEHALEDAKLLANIYVEAGYIDVEAKAGVHHGTFKVYVNFIPVADITMLAKIIFQKVKDEAINVDGILYAPPNFLRMNMYLELSRPAGDVSRWEKVYKRLILLNKHYPMHTQKCELVNFMRDFHAKNADTIYAIVRNTLMRNDVVFIGGFASSLYAHYMPYKKRQQIKNVPDFDVLSMTPKEIAEKVKNALEAANIKNVHIVKRTQVGELLPEHYHVSIGDDIVCMIMIPDGCRSYNTLRMDKHVIKVASIETLLYYFLAFIYANQKYYDESAVMCMAQYLFAVQRHNALQQKGLLRRFSLSCYGIDSTKETIFSEKAKKYTQLEKGTKEFDEWFLKYNPILEINRKTKTKLNTKNNNYNNNYNNNNNNNYNNNYNNNNNNYNNNYNNNNDKVRLNKRSSLSPHTYKSIRNNSARMNNNSTIKNVQQVTQKQTRKKRKTKRRGYISNILKKIF